MIALMITTLWAQQLPPANDHVPQYYGTCSECPPVVYYPIMGSDDSGSPVFDIPKCEFTYDTGCEEDEDTAGPNDPEHPQQTSEPMGDCIDVLCTVACFEWVQVPDSYSEEYSEVCSSSERNPCAQVGEAQCAEEPCEMPEPDAGCIYQTIPWKDHDADGEHDLDDPDYQDAGELCADANGGQPCSPSELRALYDQLMTTNPERYGLEDWDADGIVNSNDIDPFGQGFPTKNGMLPSGLANATPEQLRTFLASFVSTSADGESRADALLRFTEQISYLGTVNIDKNNSGDVTLGELAATLLDGLDSIVFENGYDPSLLFPEGENPIAGLSDYLDFVSVVAELGDISEMFPVDLMSDLRKLKGSLTDQITEIQTYVDGALSQATADIDTVLGPNGAMLFETEAQLLPGGGDSQQIGVFVRDTDPLSPTFGEVLPIIEFIDSLFSDDVTIEFGTSEAADGDPVGVASGAYLHKAVDLSQLGVGTDFSVTRFYSSQSIRRGIFGWKWSAPLLETRLIFLPGATGESSHAYLYWGNGDISHFKKTSLAQTTYVGTDDEYGKIIPYRDFVAAGGAVDCDTTGGHTGGYVLRQPGGNLFYFCAPTGVFGRARVVVSWLRRTATATGDGVTIRRNSYGDPTEVIDSLGRQVQFVYTFDRLVQQIQSSSGETWTYTYDHDAGDLLLAEGPLVEVMDSSGAVQEQVYSEGYEYTVPDLYQPNIALDHNILRVYRGGGQDLVDLEYHVASPSVDVPSFGRVSRQSANGRTTFYRYEQLEQGPASTWPYSQILPEIEPTSLTQIRYPGGRLVTEYFCGGRSCAIVRHNGRFDANWSLIPHSLSSLLPSAYLETFEYNVNGEVSVRRTGSADDWSHHRAEHSFHTISSPDRLQHGNLDRVEVHPTDGGPARITRFIFDPIVNRPSLIEDSLGRISRNWFGHHEIDPAALAADPLLSRWGVKFTPDKGVLWTPNHDINADGVMGGTNKLIAIESSNHVLQSTSVGSHPASEFGHTVERISYDQADRIIKIVSPSGLVHELEYEQGLVSKRTYSGPGIENPHVFEYEYDSAGRNIAEITPSGLVFSKQLDGLGRIISTTSQTFDQYTHANCGLPGEPCDLDHGVTRHIVYNASGAVVGYTAPRRDLGYSGTAANVTSDNLVVQHLLGANGDLLETRERALGPLGAVLQESVTSYEYDEAGRLRYTYSANGMGECFSYDSFGRLRGVSRRRSANEPFAPYRSFLHNARGVLVKEGTAFDNDSDGYYDFLDYALNGFDEVVGVSMPSGEEIHYERDSGGRIVEEITRVMSASGALVPVDRHLRVYDDLDRAIVETQFLTRLNANGGISGDVFTDAPAHQSRFGYGPGGQDDIRWITDGIGSEEVRSTWSRDCLLRPLSITKGAGSEAIETRIDWGFSSTPERVTEILDQDGRVGPLSPSERVTEFSVDEYGLVSRVSHPNGAVTRFVHNPQGYIRAKLHPNGRREIFLRDTDGRVWQSKEFGSGGLQRTTDFEYDASGNLSLISNDQGKVTRFSYDGFGNRESREIFGQSGVSVWDETYTYDPHGRLVSNQSSDGHWETVLERDRFGHPSLLEIGDATESVELSVQLNAMGAVAAVTETGSSGISSTVLYDKLTDGSIVQETLVDQHGTSTIHRAFDSVGRLHELTYPSGNEITFDYDTVSRVDRLSSLNVHHPQIVYTGGYGASDFRRVSFTGGTVRAREFSVTGRLKSDVVRDASANVVAGRTYSYNLFAELESTTCLPCGHSERFEYDGFSRLELWEDGVTGDGSATRSVGWQFDSNNNPTTIDDSDAPAPLTVGVNDLDQLESITPSTFAATFKQSGAEETRTADGAVITWTHDVYGRPSSATITAGGAPQTISWQYTVDGYLRSRTGASGTVLYRYHEKRLVGITDGAEEVEYIFDPSSTSPIFSGSATGAQLIYANYRGDIEAEYSTQGVPNHAGRYSPYGEHISLATGSPIANSEAQLGFQGAPGDSALGFTRLARRFYDANIGRFISRDPLEEGGGLNLYSYANGNPIGLRDPNGTSATGLQSDASGNGGATLYHENGDSVSYSSSREWVSAYAEQNVQRLGLSAGADFFDLGAAEKLRVLGAFASDTKAAMGLANARGLTNVEEELGRGLSEISGLRAGINLSFVIDAAIVVSDLPSAGAELAAKSVGLDPRWGSGAVAVVQAGIAPVTALKIWRSYLYKKELGKQAAERTARRAKKLQESAGAARKKATGPSNAIRGNAVERQVIDAYPKLFKNRDHIPRKYSTDKIAHKPDLWDVDRGTIGDVKNIINKRGERQGLTKQLQAFIDFAHDNDLTFELYINGGDSNVAGPLADEIERIGGRIIDYTKKLK